ncbi:type IV pilus biogenesis protein EbsA [Sphaerothrix gracilis]|uniref:type IV pilus biogenesis protein EbsA n=1 Tax=Sphaerothrix gracilis TaxID=3151835 RepID=UPI003D15FB11
MSISIEEIKPASKQEIGVYMPYYQGTKRQVLPYAISLYKQGNLEGERTIEGGNSVPFIATWNVSMLPADLTHCRMQFDGDAELSYEVTMATFEFVDFLIDVVYSIRRKRPADFAKPFYRKLLRLDD